MLSFGYYNKLMTTYSNPPSAPFSLPSSDPDLLTRATRLAEDFALEYAQQAKDAGSELVGVVFLGAVARGYFDAFADIDIIFYRAAEAALAPPAAYTQRDGFEIHCDTHDYAQELAQPWDMAKRWAFTTHRLFADPQGLLARLYAEKLPLRADERRWLMIEGMTQSDWYCVTLPELWIARGDRLSAQYMFSEGINMFLNALFGLNNTLVADVKWRLYAAQQLAILPKNFSENLAALLETRDFTAEDIQRRRAVFQAMWGEMLPLVEKEVGMSYAEFGGLV